MESKTFCHRTPQLHALYPTARPLQQPICSQRSMPKVIVLAGPTAVGKSDLALQLAQRLSGELISADSMQVYRGMDLGSAKPTAEQQAQVPHHMIDLCDLNHVMNVAEFCQEAYRAIESVLARSKVPIVVGGSGFYVDAIVRGVPPGPPSDPLIRAHLEKELQRLGPEPLYAQLQKLDPLYAETITRADRHKIVRALEIMILTQSKVSQLQRYREKRPWHFLCYFLHRPRPVLYDRINRRCELMLELGLIEEVERLLALGLLDNPSARDAIGYRQVIEFLNTTRSPSDLQQLLIRFQQSSRHYAKRQFTWFRKDPLFAWLDLELSGESSCIERLLHDYHD